MERPGREALDGHHLTSRQVDVLRGVRMRSTNAEIAATLAVSERTVESHVSTLLRKFGARDRRQLVCVTEDIVLAERATALPHAVAAIAARGDCVGRDEELERLVICWAATATRTTVTIIRGEAGIGKTRLTAAVASEVVQRGGHVMYGTCVDGPDRPYEPFVAAIRDDAARRHPDREQHRAAGSIGEIVDPERHKAAAQAALQEQLSQAAGGRRLLLVVEDLHWASVGTREVVAHIARAGTAPPMMLLVTTRDDRRSLDRGLDGYLGRLGTLPAVETVTLSGLDVEAARQVIAAVGGDLDPEQGVRQTGGNPLYLRELASGGLAGRPLRDLVADRFEQVAPVDLEVLDAAAVAGEQIDPGLLAAALHRDVADVLDALERAELAGLVGPGARTGSFAFTHDVFRAVRAGALGESRRLRLHAAIANALRERHVDGTSVAELARHACLAGPCFDPAGAVELARAAGDAAVDATDHGAAAEHFRRALESLDLVPKEPPGVRLELTIRRGAALVLIGDPNGQALLRAVAHDARRRSRPVALAQAICAMAPIPGGSTTGGEVVDQEFIELAKAALDELGPGEEALRIRVLALLGIQLLNTNAPTRGAEMIRLAVAAARRVGDPVLLGRALLSFRFSGGPFDMEQRLACGAELIALGERTGLEVFACVGRQQLWWCHRELGDLDQMHRWYESAAEHVRGPDLEQLSQPPAVAILEGELARAERLTAELADSARSVGVEHVYATPFRVVIAELRERPRDLDALREARGRHPVGGPLHDLLTAWLARALARRGRLTEARHLLGGVAWDEPLQLVETVYGWAVTMSCWTEVAAIFGHDAATRTLTKALDPLAGRLIDGGMYPWDSVDRCRALLRLAAGDAEGAVEVASVAIATSRRRGTPIYLGRELIVLAAALLSSNPAQSAAAVEEAMAIAQRTGAKIITADAGLFLPAGASQSPGAGQYCLTRREREVVDHVAGGATNAQIATALGISAATVRKHLEHAYGKLQVSTRTAAVARTAAERATRVHGATGP